MRILVIGGGPVGQLFKWAVPSAEVFEYRPKPPVSAVTTRSWGANYLWKPIPGIECRAFPVVTHIDGEPAQMDSIRAYKTKVGKGDESELEWIDQFVTHTTGYEMMRPPNVDVHWATEVQYIDYREQCVFFRNKVEEKYDVLIATLPLYSTLALCGFPRDTEPWRSSPIYVKVTSRPADARYPDDHLYVNYISNLRESVYRVTDRDGQRHFEGLSESFPVAKKLVPGKIYLHSKTEHYRHILKSYNIFTFGRYGSWNTSELIHQTWQSIVDWRESFIPNFAG